MVLEGGGLFVPEGGMFPGGYGLPYSPVLTSSSGH